MSKVIALFNDNEKLTAALDQLERAALSDDIVEVIDRGEAQGRTNALDTGVVAVAAAPAGSGNSLGFALPTHLGINDLGEAGDYFERAVQDGGRLIILDTSENEKAMQVLKNAQASRVFDSSSL